MSLAALKTVLFGPPLPQRHLLSADPRPRTYGTICPQYESQSQSQPQSERHRSPSTTSSTPTLSELEAQCPSSSSKPRSSSPSSSPGGGNGGGFQLKARMISDATIGLSDGLTVPFALTAGLSALGNTRVVVFGGFAELIAGAISMGLGGYLGAKSEIASYHETCLQTASLLDSDPTAAERGITSVFAPYSLPPHVVGEMTAHLTASAGREELVDFLVKFEHGEREPEAGHALTSGLTIAMGYLVGGLVPLLPYFFVGRDEVMLGLWISVGVMVVALFLFGYVKTCSVTGWEGSRCVSMGLVGGAQMVGMGGAAAGAAMGLVKFFDELAGS